MESARINELSDQGFSPIHVRNHSQSKERAPSMTEDQESAEGEEGISDLECQGQHKNLPSVVFNQRKPLTLFDFKVWDYFFNPGEVVEVRIPKIYGKSEAWAGAYAKGTIAGYFDDFQAFCDAARKADKIPHGGIYFTLQVIDPRLIGRAFNRLKPSDTATSDSNVIAYRWLPIDLDPVRPSGISSSDSELIKALELRDVVSTWMTNELNYPKPVSGMSGNGGHLLFRIPDLPANKETQDFIKSTLEGLANRFGNDMVHIDTSVYNPARIWKLYGTTARKGDEVPEGLNREARPYRMAFIDCLGGGDNE